MIRLKQCQHTRIDRKQQQIPGHRGPRQIRIDVLMKFYEESNPPKCRRHNGGHLVSPPLCYIMTWHLLVLQYWFMDNRIRRLHVSTCWLMSRERRFAFTSKTTLVYLQFLVKNIAVWHFDIWSNCHAPPYLSAWDQCCLWWQQRAKVTRKTCYTNMPHCLSHQNTSEAPFTNMV